MVSAPGWDLLGSRAVHRAWAVELGGLLVTGLLGGSK